MAYLELAPTNRLHLRLLWTFTRWMNKDKFPHLLSHPFVCCKKGLPRIFVIYLTVITSLHKCLALVYVIPEWQTIREEFESKVRNLEYVNKFKRRHCSVKDGYFFDGLISPQTGYLWCSEMVRGFFECCFCHANSFFEKITGKIFDELDEHSPCTELKDIFLLDCVCPWFLKA